jgi:hypothetical protein
MRRLVLSLLLSVCALVGLETAPAFAQAPWWHLNAETLPPTLPPGGSAQIIIVASNLGEAPVEGSKEAVAISAKLPAGLTATAISAPGKNRTPVSCTLATLRCTFTGVLYPYEQIPVTITVSVGASAAGSLPVQASVEGGGAGKASKALPLPVNDQSPSFGVESYEQAPYNEDGTPATQAGAHPFQLTTTLALNQSLQPVRMPVELPKDFAFSLPPGLIGNPTAVGQCTMADFFALVLETNLCKPDSVVGVATVTVDEPKAAKVITLTVPVFNLVPAQGEPARLGFEVIGKVPVVIDTSVRSGKDYGVVASVENATQTAGLLSSQVTLWGVPGDPRHNGDRGWECVGGGVFVNQVGKPCPTNSDLPQAPFLTLPTSCAGNPSAEPVRFPMQADSWPNPTSILGAEYEWMTEEGRPLGFEGCEALPFDPSISVLPEEHTAATPSGLKITVKVPQQSTLEAGKLAEADVKDTTVTLPQGVQLSPSAANGLAACSEEEIGFAGFNSALAINEFSTDEATCPDAAKLGSVKIKTPLLSHALEGSLYLATPAPNGEAAKNPFNSLVAVYLVAKDPVSGVLVKLAGEGHVDEGTLRVSTTFKNTPQVPFEELQINLFGGPRASLSTPPSCGDYATEAAFTPWSGTGTVNVLGPPEEFQITSGAGGSACPSGTLPFAPGFTAGSASTQAGAYTNFNLELSHRDGDQALSALQMHLPPGIAAMLSSVGLCSEADAAASSCPASSEVGHATAVAGLGSEPYVQEGGRVFITGPYKGAPFGLEVLTPAKAGPFDLGYVTVRSKLQIDPNDASVTITSDPLPTQIRGIPLQLKRVLVSVDRPNFQFNPTNCAPMGIQGTLTGDEGASAPISSPFQVGGCESLPFSPKFSASAAGNASKANGTTFTVTVSSQGLGQANIAKVQLQLPKELPTRLTTIQKACPEAAFNQNPASCGQESVIGVATIHTPVLRNPLSGPAYLVSHGNAAFPDVEFVLQGEGITLVLDGKTDIKNGITYSRFESAPDAPFSTFETVLPAGPHSALTSNVPQSANFSLCGQKLQMPTSIVGQNGARIDTSTPIQITGCASVKGAKAKGLTRAQKLRRCQAQARKRFRHTKPAKLAGKRRAQALRQCRARYGAKRHGRHGRAQRKGASHGKTRGKQG